MKEFNHETHISSQKTHPFRGARFPEAYGYKKRPQGLGPSPRARKSPFKRLKEPTVTIGWLLILRGPARGDAA